jgi:ribosomal protein S14
MEQQRGPRGLFATKTHCVQGHEYTPENTYRRGKLKWCRICVREKALRMRMRKRGAVFAPGERVFT